MIVRDATISDDAHVQMLAICIGQDQVADGATVSTELLRIGGFEFQVLRGFDGHSGFQKMNPYSEMQNADVLSRTSALSEE